MRNNETEIKSNDDNLFKWIEHNKERVQLLHHCIVLQRSACAFAVGNESGRILYSCILTVDEDLTYAYKNILDAIYEDVMECFFQKPIADGLHHLNENESSWLAKAIKSNEDMVPDKHTFEDRLYLV